MKVVGKKVERVAGPVRGKAWSARAAHTERKGVLLRLYDDEGRIGLGEASPLPGFSTDTVDRCEKTLAALSAGDLPARDPEDPLEIWLESAARLVDPRAPAARFALETALLDLAGQEERKPISALFREEVPDRAIPLAALAQEEESDALIEEIRAARARGISVVKLKIGKRGRFDKEIELLRGVRRAFGGSLRMRLDANGSWDLVEANDRLRALAELEPEFVEQPVIPYLLLKMGPSPVPLAADETLALPGAAERLSLVPACRVFVLKPMVLGGFLPTLRIARIGKARKVGLVVSHLFDGPVALAAAAELALALPAEPLACGLDRHAGLSAWPEIAVPQIREKEIRRSGGAGLGVRLAEGIS